MSDLKRREFVSGIMGAAGFSLLSALPGSAIAAGLFAAPKEYTVKDVMDVILREMPGAPFQQTVDTLKSGSPDQKVTGIITTMFASVEMIRKAISLNANFIIAHEPTFYNHTDDKKWVETNDVLQQKLDLLQKNNIAVWRLHDYWHAYRPDGILKGVLESLGWEKYQQAEPELIVLPKQISLNELITHVKEKLGIQTLRVIGDTAQSCSRIVIMPGASGGQGHISTMEKIKPDVFICGELHEWETAEYVRDARALGSKTALIVLGHAVSEEPGMKWLAEWLRPKLPGMKITHIAANDPFTWH